jgi:hypothetical protein
MLFPASWLAGMAAIGAACLGRIASLAAYGRRELRSSR